MLVPVFERFAEFGWQLFVEPAETYEFFTVSGVFKRARIDAKLHTGASSASTNSATLLAQRNALFDVCVASGLAPLVAAFVRAEERLARADALATAPPSYVLKEPIAVQQWTRRRLEGVERRVNDLVADEHFLADSKEPAQSELEAAIRELSGLRAVVMALVGRLKDGSRHAAQQQQQRLAARHDSGGNLLELLARLQTAVSACQCMLWLEENHLRVDEGKYAAFYQSAKDTRAAYWKQFANTYGAAVSATSCGGAHAEPMLLIENVMRSANVTRADLGGSCPPRQLEQLLQLLRAPAIQDEVVAYYSDEVEREPIEGFFRVQVALLMYFCLDRAYLSELAPQVHTGARIAHKMRAMADSFAAQLSVRDDMKLTLLALWLVENAATVNTGNQDHVTAIYDSAIGLLQQSSAMHLHQKYDLEPDLILHVIETLVHRGESVAAWKVWTTFGVDLARAPPTATELAVVIALELDLWERALALLRAHERVDLLEPVIHWLVKSHRVKELVQSATLLPDEETIFHQFMLNAGVYSAEDALKDENIRRADLLTMYYVLRHRYEAAWGVHHEHLAMIRDCTSGDTHVAAGVLSQASFQARAALLKNMCAEPSTQHSQSHGRHLNRYDSGNDVAMDADIDQRRKQPMLLGALDGSRDSSSSVPATPSKTGPPISAGVSEYSPGIYSSRASLPRSTCAKKRPTHAGFSDSVPSTPLPSSSAGNAMPPVGGLHADVPALSRRHSSGEDGARKVVQSLDFGSTPDGSFGRGFAFPGGSATPIANDAAFLGRQPVNQPPRSRFNSSFHGGFVATPNPSGVSTEDLALKPRAFDTELGVQLPVDVQVAGRRAAAAADAASVPLSSTSSTHSSEAVLETPKRFQFVREPMTDSRVGMASSRERDGAKSPATTELEEMELERIDEEFSTPLSRSRVRRTEAASAPERRNPRRSARTKY
ncbi:hypothetical protein PybrP1_011228 [[Pythium] brassicae (nom. inval.)]|nr:hypothetical protein PybrP1_011228 [[Pythium] brassicae (nom. inval.)]